MSTKPQAETSGPALPGPLAALARIRRPPVPAGERCEMCAEEIGEEHRHVVDLSDRSLMCTCRACGLLFSDRGASGGRYRAVPDRYGEVVDFALTPAQWDGLQIPVAVAFFFQNSTLDARSAFFPSPAGATECLLPLELWGEVEAANPVIATLEPDTEALLIRAIGDEAEGEEAAGEEAASFECFVVPIDACYELVGHLRTLWKGFDGGQEAHRQMEAFFAGIRARSRPLARDGSGG